MAVCDDLLMVKGDASGVESTVHIKWAAEVADHDYAAAEAYLSGLLSIWG